MAMATPNSALQATRIAMRLSQDGFAQAVREAGDRIGCPNDANKRLVQRWESGEIASPRTVHAKALEALTGVPVEALGFTPPVFAMVTSDGHGGHDLTPSPAMAAAPVSPAPASSRPGGHTGVWLSRYEYYSSGRAESFSSSHFVVLLHHGDRISVRSLPGSASSTLTMDLTVDGTVITGVWTELTEPDGYYRGARYHGALQMLAEPTGRRMAGKWVGFGKDMDVNTGPWELVFQDASTSKATLDRYNRAPESG